MGSQARRDRERLATRAKIIDAARDLFAEEGYESVSMRRIAEVIEYSPTAIYVHFKDKEDLFREICRCDFVKLSGAEAKLKSIEDPIERIKSLGRAYIKFGVEHPNHYRLMFMTSHAPAPDESDEKRKGDPDQDGYAMLRTTVEQALQAGRFNPELKDAELISQTLWALVHGVTALEITKRTDNWLKWASLSKRIDTAINAIMVGLNINAKNSGKERAR
jgi:AcrR family transcriptional regulator